MAERINNVVYKVNHEGKDIFVVDLSGMSSADLAAAVKSGAEGLIKGSESANGNKLLVMVDVHNSQFLQSGVLGSVKSAGMSLKPFVKALATVGSAGFVGYALNLFGLVSGTQTKEFENDDDAKDWLISVV
jgi:hypothetical protein